MKVHIFALVAILSIPAPALAQWPTQPQNAPSPRYMLPLAPAPTFNHQHNQPTYTAPLYIAPQPYVPSTTICNAIGATVYCSTF